MKHPQPTEGDDSRASNGTAAPSLSTLYPARTVAGSVALSSQQDKPSLKAERNEAMSIGSGIVLFVIGAVLVFAVNVDTGGAIDLDIIGYILMGAGVLVFLIGMVLMFRRRSAVTTSSVQADPATGARVTRTETDGPVV